MNANFQEEEMFNKGKSSSGVLIFLLMLLEMCGNKGMLILNFDRTWTRHNLTLYFTFLIHNSTGTVIYSKSKIYSMS